MSDLIATSLWNRQHAIPTPGAPPGAAGAAGGAEVAAFDTARDLVFVLGPNGVDALRAADGTLSFVLPKSEVEGRIDALLGGGNSVAGRGNFLAVAYDGLSPATGGTVAFYNLEQLVGTSEERLPRTVAIGPNPDHVVFTRDGSKLLVAIEGEPAPNCTADPPGGVAVIDIATFTTTFAGFAQFDTPGETARLREAGVRITGPAGTPVSRDLEPEYIALSTDGATAYVTLQENNAIGVLDPNAFPDRERMDPNDPLSERALVQRDDQLERPTSSAGFCAKSLGKRYSEKFGTCTREHQVLQQRLGRKPNHNKH